jgi:hypothetical protein
MVMRHPAQRVSATSIAPVIAVLPVPEIAEDREPIQSQLACRKSRTSQPEDSETCHDADAARFQAALGCSDIAPGALSLAQIAPQAAELPGELLSRTS